MASIVFSTVAIVSTKGRELVPAEEIMDGVTDTSSNASKYQ